MTDRTVPDTLTSLTNADGLAVGGGQHTCSVVAAANAYCWGDNLAGDLGDNTTTERLAPTPVLVLSSFPNFSFLADLGNVALAGGQGHTCAVIADGSLYCWGEDGVGQLGIGTSGLTDQLTAAEVPSFTLNIDPTVALARGGRTALINVIATCKRGRRLHVSLDLTQGRNSSNGTGDFACAGHAVNYPVTVRARQHHSFSPGAADVDANANIRQDRFVVDRQTWTHAVTLVPCGRTPSGTGPLCPR